MVLKTFAVICEAKADFQTGSVLAERQLAQEVEWLADMIGQPESELWHRFSGSQFLTWSSVRRLAMEHGIRAHGHFDGAPGAADAAAARRAILLLQKIVPHLDAAVLIRDDDGDASRRLGLEQARVAAKLPVVLGIARTKRECWVLAGWEPANAEESHLLASMVQEIGFDPRHRADELTASDEQAKRSAKRVLAALTRGSWERCQACWFETPLNVLRERGARTGLASFLDEVSRILAPFFR